MKNLQVNVKNIIVVSIITLVAVGVSFLVRLWC